MDKKEIRKMASFIASEVISMYMNDDPEYDIISQVESRLIDTIYKDRGYQIK